MTADSGALRGRPLLAVAIEREDWELAALCLLLGAVRAAATLPPDAVEALLEELAPEGLSRHRRRGAGKGPSRALRQAQDRHSG